MPRVTGTLALDRCPRCGIAKPLMTRQWVASALVAGTPARHWATYFCSVCGGVVLAVASNADGEMEECFPPATVVSEHVPERAREYLRQAQQSLGQPAGSLMLCASSVDAMLKAKGLREGSL